MKNIFMRVVIALCILTSVHYGIYSIQPNTAHTTADRAILFQKAKHELKTLLKQREKLQNMKKEIEAKLIRVTRGGHAAGGVTLQLEGQLKIIRAIKEELTDKIAQLMKQHPELMKYLPSDVGFLPVMPFLPIVPIRPSILPHLRML